MNDAWLLAAVIGAGRERLDEESPPVNEDELDRFEDMLLKNKDGRLSYAQRTWLQGAAERLGITEAQASNAFSELTPEQQRTHRERAKKIVLPWERPGAAKALRPPGR